MRYPARMGWALALAGIFACGSSADGAGSSGDQSGSGGGASSSSGGASSSGASGTAADAELVGVWEISGKDARGAYRGRGEIARGTDGALSFTRVITYDGVKVEDGRDLAWVWQGKAEGDRTKLTLSTSLDKRGFVVKRGALTRTEADAPVKVTGTLAASSATELAGSFAGEGIAATETWSARKASGASPLFASSRRTVPVHAAPSSSEKAQRFQLFASYQDLPMVKPYATRPEFQAAVHRAVLDTTDFDFYRANPNTLRVVGKVIDGISLAETRLRADAFRRPLGEKVDRYQAELEGRFVDPVVHMVVDGGPTGGPYSPSGDGALWTGMYIASQAYRFEVTGDPKAKTNLVTSLEALMELQEITGDPTTFARTLRPATGAPTGSWRAGTGAFAGHEWLAGGNNDMLKGLLYAYTVTWPVLCKPATAPICDRIRTNVRHLADDISVSQGFNQLTGSWLAAVVTGETKYTLKAEGYWVAGKLEIDNNPQFYTQGIADWSGTHLGFVGAVIQTLLARQLDLGGNAVDTLRASIDRSHSNLEAQRLPLWHLLHAALGTGAKTGPFVDDARWRLREVPQPKIAFDVDHRIDPTYCMSPYPSLPWKNDYLTNDRYQSLDWFPMFETGNDTYLWKGGLSFRGGPEGYETPGTDVVHAYWFARKYNLLAASD